MVRHPFKRFDNADRSRSRVLRMWALRRSTSLKSLADAGASPAFFASYLIRIASHHFNKMTQVLTLVLAGSGRSSKIVADFLKETVCNDGPAIFLFDAGTRCKDQPLEIGLACSLDGGKGRMQIAGG